ncbi:MAG: putative glycoside hydrolase [Lachnospiraceae bacterium]|nr:putative glycoside hydrolase [Lachnospiraceae bacterium]
MQYILQIFTGGWKNATHSKEKIIERLEDVTQMLPVSKVIIGWHIDPALYKEVGAFLSGKGIDMLLWLPVFSEIGELLEAAECTDLWGKPVSSLALQEGENFVFYCPSSPKNLQNVKDVYERFFGDCGFNGVFLDKIRTQSFVGGVRGVLSCGCDRCADIYSRSGLSLETVRKEYASSGDRFFTPDGYQPGQGFRFKNPVANAFFKEKGELIASSVTDLCNYFKEKNMQVGLDLYAPLMSGFVGQNYEKISACADFIKPMLYRRTEAPAGIGYEYRLMRESIPDAEGFEDIRIDRAFLREQIEAFRDLPCEKYPGIEINYREDIARTDASYVRESMEVLREAGLNGATLSWDVMLAPDAHLAAIWECRADYY